MKDWFPLIHQLPLALPTTSILYEFLLSSLTLNPTRRLHPGLYQCPDVLTNQSATNGHWYVSLISLSEHLSRHTLVLSLSSAFSTQIILFSYPRYIAIIHTVLDASDLLNIIRHSVAPKAWDCELTYACSFPLLPQKWLAVKRRPPSDQAL
jgi:hypothetical protein